MANALSRIAKLPPSQCLVLIALHFEILGELQHETTTLLHMVQLCEAICKP